MNRSDTRRRLGFQARIWLGLGLGLAALYLAARVIDFQRLGQILLAVRLQFVALALVTSLATPVLKAARWRWLFHPLDPFEVGDATAHEKVHSTLRLHSAKQRRSSAQDASAGVSRTDSPRLNLKSLSSLVVIGQAINLLIPGRWGELVRTYLTGEEAGISKSYVLGTIAAEKLVDLVVLAVLVVALIPFIALPDWLADRVGSAVVTALVVSAIAVTLLGGRSLWLKALDWALRPLPAATASRWRARVVAGLDGLTALSNRSAAMAIWGWTLAFWAIAALTNLLLFLAFNLPASPLMALFLLAVLQAGVAVPSTPGKIGVFHYLCMLALSVFLVPAATGLAYGLILHFLVVGGLSMWAAIALWRRSWNLRRLAEVSGVSK